MKLNKSSKGLVLTPMVLEGISAVIGVLTCMFGALVLCSWALDVEFFKRVSSGRTSINPMTAGAFLFSGLSLALSYPAGSSINAKTSVVAKRCARVCAAAVLCLGLLICVDYALDAKLGIDQVLHSAALALGVPALHSSTAPSTAFAFVLAGFALLFIDVTTRRGTRPSEIAALVLIFVSLFGAEQFMYEIRHDYIVNAFSSMALHTSIAFGVFGVGILSARPQVGIMSLATDNSPGAIILTRLFPLLAIAIFAAGWLNFKVVSSGIYSGELGTALFTLIRIALTGIVILWSAHLLRDMEAKRQRYENERDHFFELSRDMLCIARLDGYFEQVNSAFTSTLGYSKEELLSTPIMHFVHPEDRSFALQQVQQRFNVGKNASGPAGRFRCKDGSWKILSWSVRAFPLEGKIYASARDVSERANIIEELKAARAQAEAASIAKSHFLATMSHEIRTPMNGVVGMLDVLHRTSLKGYQVEMIDLIQESASSLLDIVNDILDFSKIEAGKLEVQRTAINVAEIVESACVLMDRFAEKQLVELTMFIDPRIPSSLEGDEQLLRQVLINLLSNAIKFSGKQDGSGCVSVRVEQVASSAGEVELEFHVRDNGVGMDATTLANLFEPFKQADASISQRFGGTGLGLAISYNLVHLMRGEISVESSLGAGSNFAVRLPLVASGQTIALPAAASEVSGLSCLVIGDPNRLARDMASYLAHEGAQVEQVENLDQAAQWLRSGKSGLWVWVIDAGTTHPTVEELMEKRSQARNLDVSFLAVVVERGKRHNLREKGTGIYMVDGNALCRRVLLKAVAVAARREVFEPRTVEAHEAIQGARTTFVKREEASRIGRLILVAEDNITNQKVIVHQLGLLGVAADVCANGIEALNRWRHGRYPLLLTDLHMPVMDGFELAATIRAEEDDSVHIGIVALTANILDGEADHCLSIGMDDYLSKPVRIDEIKKVLNYWLPPLANDLAASVPLEAIASRSPDNTLPSVHPVDTNVLKSLVGPDHEVVISFLADFQRSSCSISEELHIAWQSGALQDVGAAAHKLKSSARAVGAIELGECCERIETAVRTGKVNALQDLICQFDHTFTAVDHYLDSCLSPDHGSP